MQRRYENDDSILFCKLFSMVYSVPSAKLAPFFAIKRLELRIQWNSVVVAFVACCFAEFSQQFLMFRRRIYTCSLVDLWLLTYCSWRKRWWSVSGVRLIKICLFFRVFHRSFAKNLKNFHFFRSSDCLRRQLSAKKERQQKTALAAVRLSPTPLFYQFAEM